MESVRIRGRNSIAAASTVMSSKRSHVADVEWACGLLSRLSDQQWHDAFRAGGYNPDETRRYVAKIKAKVAQGLQVAAGGPIHANSGR